MTDHPVTPCANVARGRRHAAHDWQSYGDHGVGWDWQHCPGRRFEMDLFAGWIGPIKPRSLQ